MEINTSSLTSFSLSSYLPSFSQWFKQGPKESCVIADLRASRKDFEDTLKLVEWKEYHEENAMVFKKNVFPTPYVTRESFCSLTDGDPIEFLRFCYYQKIHKNNPAIFKAYKKGAIDYFKKYAYIKEYSSFSATMIAPGITFKETHALIQELINCGFEPTPKDVELAELILYDAIIENRKKETFIYLLHPNLLPHWNMPKEVKTIIARYLIRALKKEKNYWLLPGF